MAQEAERKEREQQEREARLIAEKEAAELRAKQQVIDAAKRERDAIEAERLEAEQQEAKRQANKKHREAIFFQAKDDLVAGGIDEEAAKQVIKLIHTNKVANVTIKF